MLGAGQPMSQKGREAGVGRRAGTGGEAGVQGLPGKTRSPLLPDVPIHAPISWATADWAKVVGVLDDVHKGSDGAEDLDNLAVGCTRFVFVFERFTHASTVFSPPSP